MKVEVSNMKYEEFEEIVKQYGDYLYRFASYLDPHQDEAQEIVQRTWIKAWTKMAQLEDVTAIKAWLRKICLNEFRMMVRNTKEEESIESLEEDGVYFIEEAVDVIQEVVVEEELITLRNGCFRGMASKLTLSQRTAFSLVDMFGLSILECAQLMELSEAAVKGLLFRARSNLVSFFADHCQFMKEENSCRCNAWKNFVYERDAKQLQLKQAFSALEFQEKQQGDQEEVRRKLWYYYRHIPITTPSKEWYDELISIIKTS